MRIQQLKNCDVIMNKYLKLKHPKSWIVKTLYFFFIPLWLLNAYIMVVIGANPEMMNSPNTIEQRDMFAGIVISVIILLLYMHSNFYYSRMGLTNKNKEQFVDFFKDKKVGDYVSEIEMESINNPGFSYLQAKELEKKINKSIIGFKKADVSRSAPVLKKILNKIRFK